MSFSLASFGGNVPVLNWIWLGLVLASIAYASHTGRMAELNAALFDGVEGAVRLVIGLVGAMVFFLGVTRVAFDGGLRDAFARALTPITRRLFPEVPSDHPAMAAMIMNMASNMMGLGNAATPFGLKAMRELARLNPFPGSASNAMVLFLAINTSAITIFPPFGTIAVRQAAQSTDAWAIWAPTMIATTCSTLCAVLAYFALGRTGLFPHRALDHPPSADVAEEATEEVAPDPPAAMQSEPEGSARYARTALIVLFFAAVFWGVGQEILRMSGELGASGIDIFKELVRNWMLPILVGGLILIGVHGRVRVYDSMIEGGKEGLQVAARIVPYMVAILAAVAMFRASGALDVFIEAVNPITSRVGVPAEVLPMAFLRPLSGSGAFGVMAETLTTYGPDSFIGYLTSTLMGSTETTFYVMALYLGAAGVVDGRHALAACLIGDVGGFIGAVAACHWFFG
jgi:spore maturation protein SpmA